MDYDVFRNAYTERFGSNAPMILSTQNIRNQDGQLISHTILKNCADSIETSPFPELRTAMGLPEKITVDEAVQDAHNELVKEVRKAFLSQLSRREAMSLQKILSFGLNTQVEIDYFLKFNDHTLVYEWNEVHSDEPSLIVNGDYSKEVSHGLQEIRVAAGLTQQELADLSGVNIRQIQKFEKGESQLQNATVETALKLADALGVDVHRLIEKS